MPRKNTNARPSNTPRPLQAVPDVEPTQAPVRTEAADKVWATLHAHPGSTAAELATAAGVGRSTAAKALAAWDAEGTVQRTACIAANGRRGGDRWSITPPAPDEPVLAPADAIDLDAGGEPVGTEPEVDGGIAETPTEPATPVVAVPDGTPSESPDNIGTVEIAPCEPQEAEVVSISPEQHDTARHVGTTSRLGKGALRGMVEDYLTEHAGQEFGPTALGKQLGRSAGAVANALEKLVTDGYAVRTGEAPKRYAAKPLETVATE